MATSERFSAERDEISRIDFLLDQLARAVESGEVPRSSYDLMAPRFLARRETLVEIVTGGKRAPVVTGESVAAAAQQVRGEGEPAQPGPERPVSRPASARTVSQPVQWTTVLTFLGAFLVVVASAIFAVVVWDIIGVAGKLGMMGSLTALFYGGGYYARRIELRAGGTALTAVASAMLLFEGWIAIDGLHLTGPMPWAVVLLVCSAAYWYTEVRLAQRFFGVVGAAAQAGWWWLLGAGMGWAEPVRLAGLAVVALIWQLASERGRDDRTVGSLARVLEWVAPVSALLLSVGVLLDLALLRNAGLTEVACAGVVAVTSGLVMWRSQLLAPTFNKELTALAQVPLFVTVIVTVATTGHSWWIVAALALMALAYDLVALVSAGASLAIPGLLAEVGLVLELCHVLDASAPVTVLALAALAVAWGVGSRLMARESVVVAAHGSPGVALVAETGAFVLMVVVSVASLAVSDRIALVGLSLGSGDASLVLGVLTGWYALSGLSRSGVVSFAGSAWSFYALAALMSWLVPDQRPEAYAAGLVALAGVWIASGSALSNRYGDEWALATRWVGRAAVVLLATGGILLGFDLGNRGTLWPATLMAVATIVYLTDAIALSSEVTAAAAAASSVLALAYAGGFASYRLGATNDVVWFAVCGAVAGALVAWGLAVFGRRARPLARYAAVAAALMPVPLLLGSVEHSGHMAGALAMIAVAWAGAAVIAGQWLVLPAGLATVLSAISLLAYLEGTPWRTVIVLSLLGLTLGGASLTRAGGPGGRFSVGARSLAMAGIAGQVLLVGIGTVWSGFGDVGSWYALGGYAVSAVLAGLGVHVLTQSARWRFEPGYHIGGLVLVGSAWFLFGAADVTWLELYTTPLAFYLVAAGYLHRRLSPHNEFPVATDVGAVGVGLGLPLLMALSATPNQALGHAGWVLCLSLIAIGGGIAAKSRWYFFGGVLALVSVALYRSFVALAGVWWLLLGFVGVAMLVIALTWERQRILVADTRERLRRSFEEWR
ncbi:MAG: hypothetical protein CVT67_09335 [Actinobacteria bacterium HGW-Actinobacteria-7]|nr:MAG: hypothetical protein CVT67_09335 [Actinobacteria bacterium HGW-Actinobacteria-7]